MRGTYADFVEPQRAYDPEKMTVRDPVFPTGRREVSGAATNFVEARL